MRKDIQLVLLGIALVAFLPAALAQQSSSAPQASDSQATASPAPAKRPKPKAKKVWTEDNIYEVRHVQDVYLDQSRAVEEAAQLKNPQSAPPASTDSSQPAGRGPIVLTIPDTVEETEQAIAQRQGMFDNFTNLLSTTQQQLDGETNPTVRATLTEKASLLKGDVADTRADLEKLRTRLEELQGKQKSGTSQ